MHLEEAQKEFSAAGAQDRVQQALDAVLEIRLAQRAGRRGRSQLAAERQAHPGLSRGRLSFAARIA